MRLYKYTAMDAQGREKKGTIEAENENDCNARLKEIGLFPTSIKKTDSKTIKCDTKTSPKTEWGNPVEKIIEKLSEPNITKIKFLGIPIITIEKR